MISLFKIFSITSIILIGLFHAFAQNNAVKILNGVSVPNDFPHFDISILKETAPGKIFIANRGGSPFMMILENDGTPYFYKRLFLNTNDFKVHPATGTLTKWQGGSVFSFVELDSKYNILDTLNCGPGYTMDSHEIQLLPNGNYLVIVTDDQIVDMSQVIERGNKSATVIGNHLQELDRSGNVIFEWRSWDHFDVLDAVHLDLTAATIDYVHMNAIAIDYDDHLLISSRNLSEITKINRKTGEILWRLGGENNQFQFLNDEYGISYQHDIRPVPGKPNQYTLFDNGSHHIPNFSRAIEFQLDTVNWIATKVWEYRHNPDRFSGAWGNVQRLPNGNTLINWAVEGLPKVTEVLPTCEIVYEMDFIEPANCYRTFRFEWESIVDIPYLIAESYSDNVTLIYNKFGDKGISEYHIYGGKNPESDQLLAITSQTFIHLSELQNYQNYYFRVTAVDSQGNESDYSNEEKVFVNFGEPGKNLILNGDFSEDSTNWNLDINGDAVARGMIEDSIYHLQISRTSVLYSDIQLRQDNLKLIENKKYVLEFDARAADPMIFSLRVRKRSDPYTDYSKIGIVYTTDKQQHYRYEFTMEDDTDLLAQIVFQCGRVMTDLFIDNVSLYIPLELNISQTNHLSVTYKLFTNYPNPFNPKTVIGYQLPIVCDVEIGIYNLLGQKIETLLRQRKRAGIHQMTWNAGRFPSGVYYYKIEAGMFQDVKKMILIR